MVNPIVVNGDLKFEDELLTVRATNYETAVLQEAVEASIDAIRAYADEKGVAVTDFGPPSFRKIVKIDEYVKHVSYSAAL